MDLVILVVVYNLSPEESATLQSLSVCCDFLKMHKHNIIIRDNSRKGYSQSQHNTLSQMLNGASFTYWHDGINLSLSEIYNSVITQQLKAEQILVIWDHEQRIKIVLSFFPLSPTTTRSSVQATYGDSKGAIGSIHNMVVFKHKTTQPSIAVWQYAANTCCIDFRVTTRI